MPGEQELARLSAVSRPEILSVSALVRSVRDLLERRFPLLWVSGEISNFTVAKSGHAYFVLKDEQAQVRCVMFRQRSQMLDWVPRDGIRVELQALVSLYEARGEFQLNVESMRRSGLGALFEAFLRLRDKLDKAGLFDTALKRDLPVYPRAIGVITSPQAAALQDVLTTLARRNAAIPVVVYPVPVQGEGAAERIAAALSAAGKRRECDVLVLCRGGGSIEDLWAFNAEVVARAIRASPIPVVTGVGHEVDFTIADFAADRRAPTPTAAAELVSPSRQDLLTIVSSLVASISRCMHRGIDDRMQRVDQTMRRLAPPGARLRAQSEVLGHLRQRLVFAAGRAVGERRWRLEQLVQRGRSRLPRIADLSARCDQLYLRLERATHACLERAATRCGRIAASLTHLDPAAVLARGYSIIERADGTIVRDSASLAVGDTVGMRFARGGAKARIEEKD